MYQLKGLTTPIVQVNLSDASMLPFSIRAGLSGRPFTASGADNAGVFGQATWAVVRAAVPLLKQLAGGKLPEASLGAAPELCHALSRLCCRTSPCGRAFAGHIFKECMPSLSSYRRALGHSE